jgi:hypothetical protein
MPSQLTFGANALPSYHAESDPPQARPAAAGAHTAMEGSTNLHGAMA